MKQDVTPVAVRKCFLLYCHVLARSFNRRGVAISFFFAFRRLFAMSRGRPEVKLKTARTEPRSLSCIATNFVGRNNSGLLHLSAGPALAAGVEMK